MLQCRAVVILLGLVVSSSAFDFRRVTSNREVDQHGELPAAPFVGTLTQKVPRSSHKKQALRELRRRASGGDTAVVAGSDDDEEYLTAITIGGQDFQVIVDTGR